MATEGRGIRRILPRISSATMWGGVQHVLKGCMVFGHRDDSGIGYRNVHRCHRYGVISIVANQILQQLSNSFKCVAIDVENSDVYRDGMVEAYAEREAPGFGDLSRGDWFGFLVDRKRPRRETRHYRRRLQSTKFRHAGACGEDAGVAAPVAGLDRCLVPTRTSIPRKQQCLIPQDHSQIALEE